jgi:hypothetical protein
MKRKIALSLGLLALCSASTIGLASTASADGAGTQARYYFKVYQHDDYNGRQASFSGTDRELNNKYWSGTTTVMNNGASSVRNDTRYNVGMWDKGGSCTGASYTAKKLSVDSDLSNNGFDNKASCVVFL